MAASLTGSVSAPMASACGEAVRCFATLLLTSVPLSIAMLVMLRYAARLRSTEVSLIGGLAVAAITSFALSLFHDLDATMMIFIWNLGGRRRSWQPSSRRVRKNRVRLDGRPASCQRWSLQPPSPDAETPSNGALRQYIDRRSFPWIKKHNRVTSDQTVAAGAFARAQKSNSRRCATISALFRTAF